MSQPQANPMQWKKQATLFLVSQNISLFGSAVVAYAIIWHITLVTSSGVWMMLSTLCAMVPQVAVSLFGGVLADRYSRKALIMLSDGFTAAVTLGMAIALMSGYQQLELLLLISALRSVGSGIQSPSVGAIYPQLVPQQQLTKVQGINQTVSAVLNLLAPPVAGIILGSVGMAATFFVDVSTAILAILVMSRIRVEKIARKDAPLSIWQDMKAGLAYTLGHPMLRRIILCFAASFFLITPAAVLSPLMVQRTFGSDVWMLTANELSWTLGTLVGGVFVSVKGQFKDKVLTVAVCLVAFGVMFGLLGLAWDFVSYLIFMGIGGFFLPAISTAQTVHIQEITEPEVLGRVFSIVDIITASAMPVAILIFGPLADVVSVQLLLIVSGVLLALVGVLYGASGKPGAPAGMDAPA
ncbi:MAG TPA: MFS transporter [Candidatus Limiplasma sp.]|nr:MFS transporter [Candidatus Limiplasma sp.]HPS81176.1 MFS transporter [Candidatus Limiplasma sp.]